MARTPEQTASLIKAVKNHAYLNYENDWDYVAETFTDAEIIKAIGHATTPEDAIKKVARIVKLLGERRRDIQSTAW